MQRERHRARNAKEGACNRQRQEMCKGQLGNGPRGGKIVGAPAGARERATWASVTASAIQRTLWGRVMACPFVRCIHATAQYRAWHVRLFARWVTRATAGDIAGAFADECSVECAQAQLDTGFLARREEEGVERADARGMLEVAAVFGDLRFGMPEVEMKQSRRRLDPGVFSNRAERMKSQHALVELDVARVHLDD